MSTLTLGHLHTLYRLAELGSFARTAEELGLTPPAITLQMKALSAHFGVPLVEIVKRRPVLTDAGRFLAQRSRELLESTATLEREMHEFASARTGQLAIGATLTIGTYVLPGLLARFHARRPEAVVRIAFGNAAELVRLLGLREINLALAIGPFPGAGLASEAFGEDRLVVVVPARDHALSGRVCARADELAHEKFVARESSAATRLVAERAFAAAGIAIEPHLVLPSAEGVLRAVEAGLGVAVLSSLVAERAVAEGRLHALELCDVDLRREFHLVTVRDRLLAPLATEFAAMLRADGVAAAAAAAAAREARTALVARDVRGIRVLDRSKT